MKPIIDHNSINPASEYPESIRWFEIVAVVVTGLGKFLLMDMLNWRLGYISVACAFWLWYVIFRYRKDRMILTYWGFSRVHFKQTFLWLLPVGTGAIILFLIVGEVMETHILSWHILPILILYPIWGTIQQFLMVGLVTGNLMELDSLNLPRWLIVFLTATLFSVVHFPHVYLVAGTFILALVYAAVYMKKKNLYVLGLFHGWVGAFFFYTILARDPFGEVFGRML